MPPLDLDFINIPSNNKDTKSKRGTPTLKKAITLGPNNKPIVANSNNISLVS